MLEWMSASASALDWLLSRNVILTRNLKINRINHRLMEATRAALSPARLPARLCARVFSAKTRETRACPTSARRVTLVLLSLARSLACPTRPLSHRGDIHSARQLSTSEPACFPCLRPSLLPACRDESRKMARRLWLASVVVVVAAAAAHADVALAVARRQLRAA